MTHCSRRAPSSRPCGRSRRPTRCWLRPGAGGLRGTSGQGFGRTSMCCRSRSIPSPPRLAHGARRSTLARAHGISVHDATYLELAARLRMPLTTLDRDLRAARACGGCRRAGNRLSRSMLHRQAESGTQPTPCRGAPLQPANRRLSDCRPNQPSTSPRRSTAQDSWIGARWGWWTFACLFAMIGPRWRDDGVPDPRLVLRCGTGDCGGVRNGAAG